MSLAKPGRPVCRCVEEINCQIEDRNTEIVTELFTGAVVIATTKRETSIRRRPIVAVASYCPFCGKAYAKSGLEARAAKSK